MPDGNVRLSGKGSPGAGQRLDGSSTLRDRESARKTLVTVADPKLVLRLLRPGFALAIIAQSAYIGANYAYLPPSMARLALPFSLLGVIASLLAAIAAFNSKRNFVTHWKLVTLTLCLCMVVAWTGATVTVGQQVQLFLAILALLMATCSMVPWGAQWQAFLSAGCIACCAVNSAMVRPATALNGYLWIDLLSIAVLTTVSSRLWEKWRGALVRSTAQLREEIVEREAAQSRLEASEATLHKALDAHMDPVSIVRRSDHRYIYVNEAYLQRASLTREQILGQAVGAINPDMVNDGDRK